MNEKGIFINEVQFSVKHSIVQDEYPWDFHKSLPFYEKTPLLFQDALTKESGVKNIIVKDESNRLGLTSFKPLGAGYALYKMADELMKSGKEIITATAGNHGVGVAFFGKHFGIPTTIYIPEFVSEKREDDLRGLGATVVRTSKDYDETVEIVKKTDSARFHIVADTAWEGYKQIPILIRQGYYTLFNELVEELQRQELQDVLLLLQGGVGTFASSGIHYLLSKQTNFSKLRFCIVEPENAACLFESALRKEYTSIDVGETKAGCLACGEPNPVEWEYIAQHTHLFLKASDADSERGISLLNRQHIQTSHTGAITLGAFLSLIKTDKWKSVKNALHISDKTTIICINTEGVS